MVGFDKIVDVEIVKNMVIVGKLGMIGMLSWVVGNCVLLGVLLFDELEKVVVVVWVG